MASRAEVIQEIRSQAQAKRVDPAFALAVFEHENQKFNPTEVNPESGAAGIGQIMPKNYKAMGIDPFDYKQNIAASLQLLQDRLRIYKGDITKVLASYGGFTSYLKGKAVSGKTDPKAYIADIMRRWRKWASFKILITITKQEFQYLLKQG